MSGPYSLNIPGSQWGGPPGLPSVAGRKTHAARRYAVIYHSNRANAAATGIGMPGTPHHAVPNEPNPISGQWGGPGRPRRLWVRLPP